MTALLVDSAVRVAVLSCLILLTVIALRGRSAALRHWVLAAGVTCALALPLVQLLVPPLTVIAPAAPGVVTLEDVARVRSAGQAEAPARPPAPSADAAATGERWSAVALMGAIWFAGAALCLIWLGIALARLAWIASQATPVQNERWRRVLDELSTAYGIRRRVELLHSRHPALLVTWGLLSPKILLPEAAAVWPDDRIRVVLAHELAHVRRHDWISQIAAELLVALHWFNPIVWIVSRRLRAESERACDDVVLTGGVEATAYATHLLDVARGFSGHRTPWSPAPAIASPSHLERRVRAMLNDQLNRRPLTPAFRVLVAVALLGITLPIAALAQASFSSFSGSVVDPMNGLLPKVTLVLTNTQTQAKYEVRSDEAGRFQFVGLPPADYLLETTLPGFSPLRGTVSVTGQDVYQDLRLDVGELEETITVTDGGGVSPRSDQPAAKKRPLPVCAEALPGGIGGRIRPPHKIRDVRPRFPDGAGELTEAQIVRIDAVIATDGSVKEATVVPPADPAFAAAAVEAVRQWEFDETLLNCVPVEVVMRVSVTFRSE